MKTVLVLIIVLILAALGCGTAGWLLGARKTDLHWQKEFRTANLLATQKYDLRRKEIRTLEQSLVTASEEAKILRDAERERLEKQREKTPASDACAKCRIPRERLFLPNAGPKPNGSGKRTPAAKSSRSVAKEATKTGLLRPWTGEFWGTGAGNGLYLSR